MQEQAEKLNWNGINFPASWNDIDKFEKNNPTIYVNVLKYESLKKKLEWYDTIRYDSGYLTCSKKLTGSQLSLYHTEQTKN